jgi:hypothetical protein
MNFNFFKEIFKYCNLFYWKFNKINKFIIELKPILPSNSIINATKQKKMFECKEETFRKKNISI